jgi:hypothetical protein
MAQNDPNPTESTDIIEELQIVGVQLLAKVKEIIQEGSARRIRIKQEGRVILEIPLAVGVVGVVMAPTLAAIGAMGALLAQCSIEVIRWEKPPVEPPTKETAETTSGV